ncbi:MAG: hypothetical protein NT001_06535 [Candidatus Woesearchaeota archaeon]|nr:hypothetical protein [Candidatus Woesearchaeota archaeon]
MDKKVWYLVIVLIALAAIFSSYGLNKDLFHVMTGKTINKVSASFAVSDESPMLRTSIPSKALELDTSGEIYLSYYFYEPNGDALAFNSTLPANITVSINQTTGIATLTPHAGFNGKNWITFYAYDPAKNRAESNNLSVVARSTILNYSNFSGSTTDFNSLSDQELQNISDVKIEKVDYGIISFAEAINISSNTDLTSNINISFNYIYINETALPGLDKKATLSFYNLSFNNPRILKDGAVCPASECTRVDYSEGMLVFNVTGFSSYSSEETPSETPSAPVQQPSSAAAAAAPNKKAAVRRGGGGGIPASSIYAPESRFEVDTTIIKADVRQNRVEREIVKVSNPTEKDLEVNAGLTEKIGFVKIGDKMDLAPGETKDLELVIAPTEENNPDTYTTQLVLEQGSTKIQIPFVINVQSELNLLDVEMDIYSEEIYPAGNLVTGLKISNLEEARSITANIEWFIKDLNNNIIVKEAGTADVETQVAMIKKIYLPSDILPGDYVVIAVASYDGSSAVASSMFSVSKKPMIEMPMNPENGILILLIAVAAAVVVLIIILIFVIIHEERRIDRLIKKDGMILKEISKFSQTEQKSKKMKNEQQPKDQQ